MILRRSARNYLLSVFLYSLDKMPFLSARKQAVRQKIYLKALEIRKCRRSYFIENHLEQEVNPMYLASLLEFWSSDKLTGSQTRSELCALNWAFWSSDKLTGSQTKGKAYRKRSMFWSSDKLTGSQTLATYRSHDKGFWSSDKLTGNQTLT